MKKLMQLKGVQVLSKQEQKSVNAGNTGMLCHSSSECNALNSIPGFEYEEFFCFWGMCHIA